MKNNGDKRLYRTRERDDTMDKLNFEGPFSSREEAERDLSVPLASSTPACSLRMPYSSPRSALPSETWAAIPRQLASG